MNKKKDETKFVLPTTQEELEALLTEERKKRRKLDLEKMLGKLKKMSDLVETKRKIARILTAVNSKTESSTQRRENSKQKAKNRKETI